MDFIKNIAYMIAESGDTPSYDDIYTLCKMLGKEPDADTMDPEEYESLSDKEKQEIHDFATKYGELDLSGDYKDIKNWSDEQLDKYLKKVEKWIGELYTPRDENGYRSDWKDYKKRIKNGDFGIPTIFVFTCEQLIKYLPKKYKDPDNGDIYQKSKDQTNIGTEEFSTFEEAKKWCEDRITERCKQLHIKREDFKEGHDFVPYDIDLIDANAYGYVYLNTEGTGKVQFKKRGPKPKDAGNDYDDSGDQKFDTLTRTIRLEYFIYKSTSIAKDSGQALKDVDKKIKKIENK